LCVHCFGDQMLSITPFAAPAASQGETIRFGSLEFPAIPRDGSWAPPPFPPSQTFQFGSLEFVTDQLGALRLHEEESAPAASEESAPPPKLPKLKRWRSISWRIRKRKPSQPTRVVLRRIALMMASNPAAEDVNLVLYSLANVSRQLAGGPLLPPPRSFFERPTFGLRDSVGTYVRETHKIMRGHQPTLQFVGMAGSYPDSVHDLLCYEDPLSDSSSMGEHYLEGASVLCRVCAMAAAPSEPPPPPLSCQPSHTPPDPYAQALANAQAHAEELRPQRRNSPPPANPPLRPYSHICITNLDPQLFCPFSRFRFTSPK
jgi:hypothetical protein